MQQITIIDDYTVDYQLLDYVVNFACPQCGKRWRTSTISYPMQDSFTQLPMPFHCFECDAIFHAIDFNGLPVIIDEHYRMWRKGNA